MDWQSLLPFPVRYPQFLLQFMERKDNRLADWDRLNWNHEQNLLSIF